LANVNKYRGRRINNPEIDRLFDDVYIAINEIANSIDLISVTTTGTTRTSGSSSTNYFLKTIDLVYGDFPDTSIILDLAVGNTIKKIYLEIKEEFNSGTLNIADGAKNLVDKDYVILTTIEPQEFLILKTYTTVDNLTLTLTGTPSTGSASIIIEYR